jgi:uncharacterized protein (TIRG00374 family)
MTDQEDLDETDGTVVSSGLQTLRKVSWRSVLQVVFLLLAVAILVKTIAGLDLAQLLDQLRAATWWIAFLGFVIAQVPPSMQALSTIGASPVEHPFVPVYVLQLAQSYVGLVIPSSAARIAMDVRFMQKQGFAAGTALAIGAIESFAGFIVEVVLLGGLLILTPQTLHFNLSAPPLSKWRTILLILVGIAMVFGLVAILMPKRRNQAITWLRSLLKQGREALTGLRSLRRLLLLFGGSLGAILSYSGALGVSAAALGTHVSFSDLIVIFITVSLLAGLLPIPGGIGVVESGVTFGLIAAGMPEEQAFAAAILYRLGTFYIPPIWGYPAFRWLERSDLL